MCYFNASAMYFMQFKKGMSISVFCDTDSDRFLILTEDDSDFKLKPWHANPGGAVIHCSAIHKQLKISEPSKYYDITLDPNFGGFVCTPSEYLPKKSLNSPTTP
jgi:hypothetical protein